MNFSTAHPKNSNVDGMLLGDKNATSLWSKIVSTLTFPENRISPNPQAPAIKSIDLTYDYWPDYGNGLLIDYWPDN